MHNETRARCLTPSLHLLACDFPARTKQRHLCTLLRLAHRATRSPEGSQAAGDTRRPTVRPTRCAADFYPPTRRRRHSRTPRQSTDTLQGLGPYARVVPPCQTQGRLGRGTVPVRRRVSTRRSTARRSWDSGFRDPLGIRASLLTARLCKHTHREVVYPGKARGVLGNNDKR